MERVTSTWSTPQVVVGPSNMMELKGFEECKTLCQPQLLPPSVTYWCAETGCRKGKGPLVLSLVDSPSHNGLGLWKEPESRSLSLINNIYQI